MRAASYQLFISVQGVAKATLSTSGAFVTAMFPFESRRGRGLMYQFLPRIHTQNLFLQNLVRLVERHGIDQSIPRFSEKNVEQLGRTGDGQKRVSDGRRWLKSGQICGPDTKVLLAKRTTGAGNGCMILNMKHKQTSWMIIGQLVWQ